jgi:hypothetical protein
MAYRILFTAGLLFVASANLFANELSFRTDAGADEKLPWYQIQPGVFPPEESAHYFAGELIRVDHVNRKFVLRTDRTDAQNRSHFDLPVGASMLPFGSVFYNGSPASLVDIPLGTHLHGLFYQRDPESKEEPIAGWHGRVSPEADFNRCLRLEDDFSYRARQHQAWRVNEINPQEKMLVATLVKDATAMGEPVTFELPAAVRVWKGNRVVLPTELAVGDIVQLNLTWATLYGPGRITEIWADAESQQLAASHQLEKHTLFTKQRGLPGWIDAVDNQKRVLTITFFDNVHPQLIADLKQGTHAQTCVAEESLRMYDPVNDRKGGAILQVTNSTSALGSSGIQAQIQVDLLLEGFRPGEIVRVFPSGWPIVALPKEEELFGIEQ